MLALRRRPRARLLPAHVATSRAFVFGASPRRLVICVSQAPQTQVSCHPCNSLVVSRKVAPELTTQEGFLLDGRPRSLTSFLRILLRAAFVGALLVPPFIFFVISCLVDQADEWQAHFEQSLLRALGRGGPCLTKLGQWASTRPDILPPSLCSALSTLHHSVEIHSLEHTEMAILDAFGTPSNALFRELDPVPIGSGCIAQVHKAVTFDGVPIAVKVLHPKVESYVADDLFLLRRQPTSLSEPRTRAPKHLP